MTVALSELVQWLKEDVPQYSSVPSDTQYDRCVKDAVVDYGAKAGRKKVTTISIVSGTASYALPSDFLQLIRVSLPEEPADGVIISSSGLVPVGSSHEERWYVEGDQITFYPTPTYDTERDVWYAAGFVLDGGEYAEMTGPDAAAVTLKAKAQALRLQANRAAQEAWEYAIGDERVNKQRLAQSLREQAESLESQYAQAVTSTAGAGPWGMRSRYDSLGR